METPRRNIELQRAWQDHDRHWRDNAYVYPVVSRRSKGLSIGVNLNPDKACNFDCIYCQVDRSTPPAVRKVDLDVVRVELANLLDRAIDGTIFNEPPISALPPDQRIVRDIAFSGDGEPTTYARFDEAVALAAELKQARGLDHTKLVLITDACYLTKPNVKRGLALMDAANGEIWAKLDAGTQAYYEAINRPNYPLSHVLANILDAARERPIVIQSLWMRVHGSPPPDAELLAYCDRIRTLIDQGARIKLIQVYTIARETTEPYATALSADELRHAARIIEDHCRVPIESFGGAGIGEGTDR
ncbi:MAG: radical SAM protein [Phycisphaerales bacterium]|nr:radical SAM protein [Phycisphaerales bacterium]MCB9857271.1 radical SAM protein [Phycisphaerales bacterium]MCB9863015.1 radical SAM protein [Phycisphaerales bacterium]